VDRVTPHRTGAVDPRTTGKMKPRRLHSERALSDDVWRASDMSVQCGW
jgi:hypothetical protein